MGDDSVGGRGKWTRILWTLALLGVLRLAAQLQLPGVDTSSLVIPSGSPSVSVLVLGIEPFQLSFVFAELLSFVFPTLGKLRRRGNAGRRTLNTFAMRIGIAIALFQAFSIAAALQNASEKIVPNPGFLFLLTCVMTLAAGTALTFAVAMLASRRGFGNGFCLIVLFQLISPAFAQARSFVWASDHIFGNTLEVFTWLTAIGLLARRFALRPVTVLKDYPQQTIPLLALPAFPQGIIPVNWAYGVFNVLSSLGSVVALPIVVEQSPIALVGIAVLVAAFSLGAFHLFSNRGRLERNLPPGALSSEDVSIPRRSLLQSTALLVVFGTIFTAGEWFLDFRFSALPFPALVVLLASVFDLVAEWRFRQRHGDGVACLIEMDNVYSACSIQGLLARQGFDSLIRTFHFRSLFFDFGTIAKMELLVPAAELELIREIIRPESIEVV